MAVAYSTSLLSNHNAASSVTQSIDSSGTNPIVLWGVEFAVGTDVSGTPTYNGSNMTMLGGAGISTGGATFDKAYVYYIVPSSPGVHDLVVNGNGSDYIYTAAAVYTGVHQASPIDTSGTNTNSGSATIAKTVTTSTDNCLLAAFFVAGSNAGALGGGSGATDNGLGSGAWDTWLNNTALSTPAGSATLNASAGNSSGKLGLIVAALAPAAAAASTNNGFSRLMGRP